MRILKMLGTQATKGTDLFSSNKGDRFIFDLQSAVNTATKTKVPYGERVSIDGWQLEFKPPRAAGELPTIIHARYTGAH